MSVEEVLILLITFVLGLLTGAVIKKAAKLLILIGGVLVLLVGMGRLEASEIKSLALKMLQGLSMFRGELLGPIPYGAPPFLLGLALGLWKE